MKIENVYIASNGDIFAEYSKEALYEDHTPEEVAELYQEAAELLAEGSTKRCGIKRSSFPIDHLSYYDESGEFIATAGIHVTAKLSDMQEFFYISRQSGRSEIEKLAAKIMRAAVK